MGDDDELLEFKCLEDELEFWKIEAQKHQQIAWETQQELQEFQHMSRDFEKELEMELKQYEDRNRELLTANNRLQMELESYLEKLEAQQYEAREEIGRLETNLAETTAVKDQFQKYIRELEQTNDDLERTKRATIMSLEDFEQRMNQAIERNAFLESELDEKECLTETVQRLKDEARDLRHELAVKQKRQASYAKAPKALKPPKEPSSSSSSSSEELRPHKQTLAAVPLTSPSVCRGASRSDALFTASMRISALNIVGELLRKVGSLESKLASCREFMQQQTSGRRGAPPPPVCNASSENALYSKG